MAPTAGGAGDRRRATALVLVAALIGWLAVGQPRPRSRAAADLRQALLSAPADAQPVNLPWAPDGQLARPRLADLADQRVVSPVLTEDGFRAGAARGWQESNGAVVIVELMRFDGPERADRVRVAVMFAESEKLGGPGTRDVSGLDAALTFTVPAQDGSATAGSVAIGTRRDVLFLIIRRWSGAPDAGAVEALARDQYARL